MIRSADLIVNRLREGMENEGGYAIFIITNKGRDLVSRIFGEKMVERIQLHDLDAVFVRPSTGKAFLKDAKEAEVSCVDTTETLTYYVALLHARHLVDKERARVTEAMVHAHFTPLLEVAFAEDDDDEIARLADQVPWGITPRIRSM